MLFSWKQVEKKIGCLYIKRLKKGGALPWKWHFSPKSVLVPRFTVSGQEWVHPAAGRCWRQDAQKEERFYQHRSQKCGLFLFCCWIFIIRKKEIMKFSESLKKNHQFRFVYQYGKSFADKYLVMYVKENSAGGNRIGISVSRKVGNSVVGRYICHVGARRMWPKRAAQLGPGQSR